MSAFSLSTLFGGITDEQAMWRVQTQDDTEAFAVLLRRWEGPIQRLCTRMLGDAHRGKDLAQESFAKIYARRADYKATGKFSSYLWRISLNLCYDELRRVQRRAEFSIHVEQVDEPVHEVPLIDSGPRPDAHLEQREQAESVRAAMLELPEHLRAVLVLRHYENLKFREIADTLEIPEGTVKSRMTEALALLGRKLHRQPAANSKPRAELALFL